jgi:hypothetical protein
MLLVCTLKEFKIHFRSYFFNIRLQSKLTIDCGSQYASVLFGRFGEIPGIESQ